MTIDHWSAAGADTPSTRAGALPMMPLSSLTRARDVVVVGAGIGGLSAAITLAAHGARVTVLEASEAAGGKAGCIVADGVRVDTGPSVVTMPWVFDALVGLGATTGLETLPWHHVDPAFRYLYPDGTSLDVFATPARTLASVHETLGRAAADELSAFLDYAARIWTAAAPDFVLGPAPSVGGLLRLSVGALAKVRHIDATRTMLDGIRAHVRDPYLRDLLMRYATYNGSDPRRAPATLNCIAQVELGYGGWGVRGGVYTLIEHLVAHARHLGVTFRYNAPVQSIEVEVARRGPLRRDHARVVGVRCADGTHREATAVVANADAAHVFSDLLPPAQRRETGAPSMSGWTAIVRARRRSDRTAHTVVFPANYALEFEEIFDRGRTPTEPTIYICAQEVAHASHGWSTDEPLFVMVNAPAEPAGGHASATDWDAVRGRVRQRLLDTSIIESTDTFVWQRTPANLAAQYAGSRGAIYGPSSNDPTAAFRRPANRVRGVTGLYLASGSSHPGGGLPLCALSGRAAAAALIDDANEGRIR